MHHIFIHVQGRKREELAPTASGRPYQKSFPEAFYLISKNWITWPALTIKKAREKSTSLFSLRGG